MMHLAAPLLGRIGSVLLFSSTFRWGAALALVAFLLVCAAFVDTGYASIPAASAALVLGGGFAGLFVAFDRAAERRRHARFGRIRR
jgi:hypothetical protein